MGCRKKGSCAFRRQSGILEWFSQDETRNCARKTSVKKEIYGRFAKLCLLLIVLLLGVIASPFFKEGVGDQWNEKPG